MLKTPYSHKRMDEALMVESEETPWSVEALFRALGRRSSVTLATLHKYAENVAVSGDRIRQTLGFEPATDLETGWRRTVTTMRQEGRL